jgi:PAS domain S-box-containing protein
VKEADVTQSNLLEELKRYVRFSSEDEAALRAFGPLAAPSFPAIADHFYARLREHENARRVFTGPEQVQRLKSTLQTWLATLLSGPWDDAYLERRSRIGRMHVRIGLPQRYMFAAMSLIRSELVTIAEQISFEDSGRAPPVMALHKIIDIELAIMLETYTETSLHTVQESERQRRADVEYRLELSEARYDEIVEKAEALITTSDREGRVLLFNATAARITGVSKRNAVGQQWLDLFVPDADRARVRLLFAEVMRGGSATYEGPAQTGAPAGSARRRVRWHFTTLPDGREPVLCAIGIDVSNEHELSVRTRRAERLAALGTMAAGLAHEIRNPLNAASLQLSVARRKLARSKSPEGDPVATAVEVAEGEMQRLANMVDDFLQFARPQPLRLSLVDLRNVASDLVDLTEPEAKSKGVSLDLKPGPAVLLELDVERMKQVVLNLMRNAVEAVGPGGAVSVEVGLQGDSAALTVRDSGPGFAAEAPIFEPFFTTKENGTGLGLAIAHRIVMDHGGTISAESRPGETAFRIALPTVRTMPG